MAVAGLLFLLFLLYGAFCCSKSVKVLGYWLCIHQSIVHHTVVTMWFFIDVVVAVCTLVKKWSACD